MVEQRIRRSALAMACAALLTSGVVTGCGAKKTGTPSQTTPAPETAPAPPATLPPSPAPTAPAPAKAPELPGAIGVMVENAPAARPQAGLDKADIVYEMEAEGGITRFLALFYTAKAEKIGPVRSARMGFYEVALSYGIPYAHAGGNYDVLAELRKGNPRILNVDEIYGGSGGYFWRATDRSAPHNLYTSTEKILAKARAAGFALRPLSTFPTGDAPAGGKAVSELAFSWGPRTQTVSWTWDGGRYLRAESDTPHTVEGGARLAADNVVVLLTAYRWDPKAQDGEGENYITIVGSGKGYLYRGGQGFAIKWAKASREEPFRFTTADGQPVNLAPGQTWVEVLKDREHITAGLPE